MEINNVIDCMSMHATTSTMYVVHMLFKIHAGRHSHNIIIIII